MDSIDWKILDHLQADGRASYTLLAKQVGLSVPTVTERVKRLEESGVIRAFTAHVSPQSVGYPVTALIGITVQQPVKAKFTKFLTAVPEVLECYHVTGEDSYRIKIVATDIGHLERLIGRINLYGETRTSIVMSTPIESRPLSKPGAVSSR
jgi:Lrp/AsnC family leucine-responsive transcriptional regulator